MSGLHLQYDERMVTLTCKHCDRTWTCLLKEWMLDENNYCCGDYSQPVHDPANAKGTA